LLGVAPDWTGLVVVVDFDVVDVAVVALDVAVDVDADAGLGLVESAQGNDLGGLHDGSSIYRWAFG
jgi:hypothetical protein